MVGGTNLQPNIKTSVNFRNSSFASKETYHFQIWQFYKYILSGVDGSISKVEKTV